MADSLDLPIFLEDRTGLLTGSEFVDLYNRMTIGYRCISYDSTGTTYAVIDRRSIRTDPEVVLRFNADNSLGTIKVNDGFTIAMDIYLPRVSIFSRCNIFVSHLIIAC